MTAEEAGDNNGTDLTCVSTEITKRVPSLWVDFTRTLLPTPSLLKSTTGGTSTCYNIVTFKDSTLATPSGVKVTFLNVDMIGAADTDELLLGRTFLDTTCFNVCSFIKKVAPQLGRMDLSRDNAMRVYAVVALRSAHSAFAVGRLSRHLRGFCSSFISV